MDAKVVLRELAAAVMAGDRRAWASVLLSVVVAGALVNPPAAARAVRKASLYVLGALHLLFGRDKKFKKPRPNPDLLLACPPESVSSVSVIFMRHGESEWNEVFNKGFGISFPFRLVRACVRETFLWFTSDSVFLDSPLSFLGMAQATALSTFLDEPRTEDHGLFPADVAAHALLRAAPGSQPSVLATSNLRRAAATTAVALAERLRRTGEPVHVLSSLQEISPNVDTLTLSVPYGPPPLREKACAGLRTDNGCNRGNKPVRGRGDMRLEEFAAWCFTHQGKGVVAAGHSLWFRYFMDAYLPPGVAHESRKKKVKNCALLAFTLQKATDAQGCARFRIMPETIAMVYGGYH